MADRNLIFRWSSPLGWLAYAHCCLAAVTTFQLRQQPTCWGVSANLLGDSGAGWPGGQSKAMKLAGWVWLKPYGKCGRRRRRRRRKRFVRNVAKDGNNEEGQRLQWESKCNKRLDFTVTKQLQIYVHVNDGYTPVCPVNHARGSSRKSSPQSYRVSWKSLVNFSRNPVHRQTDKQTPEHERDHITSLADVIDQIRNFKVTVRV